ncbi:hypothetical protein B0A50_01405 [Salinomyces thailandicus]|uniref:Mediator of RNA polymerase II transcription subunit 9 n=1 Tax=Salinomyces thailandicus TaxID=706561 RepID=A0A4U0UAI5_9PEZI|nr:hypothetical protein B0A50_01405 [Salinomyces thailandica]
MAAIPPAASSASHTQTNVTIRTPSEPQTTQQPTLPLPAPQLFDILPALHEILARIDHSSTDPTGLAPDAQSDVGTGYSDLQPLDPKDLPTAVLPLKTLMRKGLREVEKLPDIERSVEEQETEIQELEDRIRRQRAAMTGLAESAKRALEGLAG